MTYDQNVTTATPAERHLAECCAEDKETAALNKLWDETAAIFDYKDYGDMSDAVFHILLGKLMFMAKCKGADTKSMMEPLFEAMLNCGPKGRVSRLVSNWGSELHNRSWPGSFLRDMVSCDEDRLFRLLYQAYSLMKCGDESIIACVLFDLYKEGHLTDEEWKSEMAAIGTRPS
jgi:hypothetical protein